jgi:hypothetical protein
MPMKSSVVSPLKTTKAIFMLAPRHQAFSIAGDREKTITAENSKKSFGFRISGSIEMASVYEAQVQRFFFSCRCFSTLLCALCAFA